MQTRLNRAQAKLNALALFAQRPRAIGQVWDGIPPDEREVADPAVLMSEHHVPWVDLVPTGKADSELVRSVANKLIHPPYPPARIRSALVHFEFPQEVLASQCLDREWLYLLQEDHAQEFLEWRAMAVAEMIGAHVQSHALFGFKDGPDLDPIFDLGEEMGPDAA
jgi:hypothetical protein